MRGLVLVLATLLMCALESPFLYQASVAQYTPDLVLLVVMYVGLTSTFERGLGVVLLLGLMKDGFAMSSPLGMYMEISVLAFFVSYRLSRRLALRGPVAVMLIAVVFSLGASVLELGLSLIFDRSLGTGEVSAGLLLHSMLPQALATAPFAPVIFWLFEKLDGLVTRKNESVYL